MQHLLDWTLETIREQEACFSWLEEYRYEWAPLVNSAVSQVVAGKTVLILTDESRDWFGQYIMSHINSLDNNRPLLPFYHLKQSFTNFTRLSSISDIELFEDMLDISYPNGYYIWYIGREDSPCTKLAFRDDTTFSWLIDGEIQNSFKLKSSDNRLDVKLLHLYRLFDKTISASLFGDLDLDI